MKKFFFIGFFIAIASMCSANAGYLSLEDDSDIGRVYRNVANFCNYHHDQLLELKNKNFNLNDCQSSFDEIINGNSDLINYYPLKQVV